MSFSDVSFIADSTAARTSPALWLPERHVVKPYATTPITGFQAGHGFFTSLAAGATSNMNDTSAWLNGNQCATVVTDGAGGNNYLKHNSITPLLNLTNQTLRVWYRLPNPGDIQHLSNVLMYVSSDNVVANYYGMGSQLQGLNADMYGNDYGASSGNGYGWQSIIMQWGRAVVTGTPTIGSINSIWFRVNDDATGHPVTIQFGGIEMLPQPTTGVVSFTFDDSRATQYQQARLKLSQYRYPATAYTIADLVDSNFTLPGVSGPGYMTTEQLRELQDYHGWDIAGHAGSVNNHNLPNGYADMSNAAVVADMQACKTYLANNGFKGLHHWAVPKGKHVQSTYDALRQLALSNRTTYSQSPQTASPGKWISHETYPPSDPLKLNVWYTYGTSVLADMEAAVDQAATNKEWLIFVHHDLVTTPDTTNLNDTQSSIANFSALVDYVNGKGAAINVRTVADVITNGA